MPEYLQWTLVGLGVLLFVWLATGSRSSDEDDDGNGSTRRWRRRSHSRAWRPRHGLPAAIRARARAGRASLHARTRGQGRRRIAGRRNSRYPAPPIDSSLLPRPLIVNISWSSGGMIINVPYTILTDGAPTLVPTTPLLTDENTGSDSLSREARSG